MKRAFSENEISGFLTDIIGQNSKFNQQKITESIYLVQINAAFQEIIPAALQDHVYAYKYGSGKLLIHTDHGIYAQQLQLYSREIITRLQEKVSPEILKIEIRVGNIYRKSQKTGDIMSRNENMTHKLDTGHPNADLLSQLIAELKKST